MAKAHYNRESLAAALTEVGVQAGDVVFTHSNIGYFGIPEEGRKPAQVLECVLGAFQDVLGPSGTLVVPTFSYSFCKGQSFDVKATPSDCGAFSEYVRQRKGAVRSHDPIFSVACLGAQAEELASRVGVHCFGQESFWERFLNQNGLICNLNFDAGSTFVHYVERQIGVPYRYDKLFVGRVVQDPARTEAVFACNDASNPSTHAAFERFDMLARQEQVASTSRVGRGAIVALRATDTFSLIERELERSPWFLTHGGKSPGTASLSLSPKQVPATHTESRCDVVSVGQSQLVATLHGRGFTKHRLRTGAALGALQGVTHAFVPELFQIHEATVRDPSGGLLDLTTTESLWVAPYSTSFAGTVSRKDLLARIEPRQGPAALGSSLYYDRTWGLVGDSAAIEAAPSDEYTVTIRTSLHYGEMSLAELKTEDASSWLCLDTLGLSTTPIALDVTSSSFDDLRRALHHLNLSLWLVPGPFGLRAAQRLCPAPAQFVFLHEPTIPPSEVLDYWSVPPNQARLVPLPFPTTLQALVETMQRVQS